MSIKFFSACCIFSWQKILESAFNLTKIDKPGTETFAMLKEVYEYDTMSNIKVFDGYCCFKEGIISVESDEHLESVCIYPDRNQQ